MRHVFEHEKMEPVGIINSAIPKIEGEPLLFYTKHSLWANGPFTDTNIQLEEFPMDALCSPKSIIGCHFLDEADHLG